MFKILSDDYFTIQKPNGQCDIYTLGQRCEPVKCITALSIREAILWVQRYSDEKRYAKC
jgi:hypothetical protein